MSTKLAASPAVAYSREGEVAVVTIDHPPVNAISPEVVAGLEAALARFEADAEAAALVVRCAGRTFVAGGDIRSFEAPGFSAQPYNRLLARLEASTRPVIAALHGTVLGVGLELALACHWRVAAQGTRFGFPEVRIGLLPGSLGTQRMPRLVGVPLALDLISSGRDIDADNALAVGVVDAVAQGDVFASAVAFARARADRADAVRRLSESAVDAAALPARFFDDARARAAARRGPAAAAIVEAVQASLRPFAEGEAEEARLFESLRTSPESRALRHLFFARREAARIPGLPADASTREVRRVGILGGGTMGRGIAMSFLDAGFAVVLVETGEEALSRALAAVRATYDASVTKGRLGSDEAASRIGRLAGKVDDVAIASCDLVIEAVFEDMALKTSVMRRLGALARPGAILATNTSTLDVDRLAEASGRAGDVVGMHFFSPAHVMRLLEVVRGRGTAPEVLASAMQIARRIGKTAVVSGVCYGFIGNRMAEPYMREAEYLIMEGATPAQVDAAVESIGMAMGPCRMLDMAGIDVGAKTVIELGKSGGLPPDPSYRALARRLFELGRFGQKTGAGYYRYDGGRMPVDDPQTILIAEGLAIEHGIVRRNSIPRQEVFERLLHPMINEAAKILEEGIASRPGDIDVVWTSGYGFPDTRGGPAFMADEIGLATIVASLEAEGARRGDAFGYWTVSPLLKRLAASGQRLSDWRPAAP